MANKSILDDILNKEKDSISIEEEAVILKPLSEEIDLIINDVIKSFVKSILIRSNSFWEIPSSFSGKYHPPDEHNAGGNVLHTKRVVRVASILCDSYSLSEDERDIIIAACLLHDITKGISSEDLSSFNYDPMHPYTVGNFISKCQAHDKEYGNDSQSTSLFIAEDVAQTILRLVRCHLGPWSPVPETCPITYMDYIVHIADNVASKIHNVIEDSELMNEQWRKSSK